MPETLQWIDAAGATHNFPDDEAKVLRGIHGRGMPPASFVEEDVPLEDGARLLRVKTTPREVTVPLAFLADDETQLRTLLRSWQARLRPAAGDGILRVTGPGGDVRELVCRYASGLELVEDGQNKGAGWLKAALVFRAADPYWRDAADTTVAFAHDYSGRPFFPFFPLLLADSDAWSARTISNGGDVEAWPVWTATGPLASLALRNFTTGKGLLLTSDLPAGATITIDTRPGAKTVSRGDGVNLFGTLDPASALWPLQPGDNEVEVGATGVTADTAVSVAYRRRWLGA